MPYLKSLPDDAGPPSIYTRYPQVYRPWSEMSQALMNGPSDLSQGERELVLAYACGLAGCAFVHVAHSEVAYAWGIESGLVERLLADPGHVSSIDARLAALLGYVRKLMLTPNAIGQDDFDAVSQAGWTESALHGAVAVTVRGAFMHRLVAVYGFKPMSRESAVKKAKKRKALGYMGLYPAFAAGAGPSASAQTNTPHSP